MKETMKKVFNYILETFKRFLHYIITLIYDLYRSLRDKYLEDQKQLQLQQQIQAKQNEQATAYQIMTLLANQIAPAFYQHNYDFISSIRTPRNLRIENYFYQGTVLIFRYSLNKNVDLPMPQWDLKQLQKKLNQDLQRYIYEITISKPLDILEFDYFYLLHNPTIINIKDESPQKKVYIDIQVS